MISLARWVLRRRILVLGLWALVAAAGVVAAPMTTERLTYDFSLPGQPGFQASRQIVERFGTGGENPPLVVIGRGPASGQGVRVVEREVRQAFPGTTVVPVPSSRKDVAVTMVLPQPIPGPDPYVTTRPALTQLAHRASTPAVRLTVLDHLSLAEGETSSDRGLLIEIAIGAVGALTVLLLVFGSVLAIAPLVIAGVSILATFLALLGVTHLMAVSFIVQFLIALIGLGVAIDFALLLTMRWREERARGRDNRDAIERAMGTAGRSIMVSGLTVAISLAMLVVIPVPFLRSVGVGGLLIPIFSVVTTLTLLPAVLSLFGDRMLWPRRGASSPRSRFWAALATATLRHRIGCAVLATAALLLAAWPIGHISLGSPPVAAVATEQQLETLNSMERAGVPVGVFRPLEVVGAPELGAEQVRALKQIPRATVVVSGSGSLKRGFVLTHDDPATGHAAAVIRQVRAVEGLRVGGAPVLDADFVTAIYRQGVWALIPLGAVTFLLLARALRSLWLPLKALLLNAVSIAAAYGLTVWIWQDGHGVEQLFGVHATGVITIWVPVAAFAFLFGLSMDYEVFILSRMREAYDERRDTDAAVVEGIANTGRLVTSGALILVFAFVGLATVPTVEVKILATTLALGIALDALVVRSILAPALVGLFGEVNWVMPRWLRSLIRREGDGRIP